MNGFLLTVSQWAGLAFLVTALIVALIFFLEFLADKLRVSAKVVELVLQRNDYFYALKEITANPERAEQIARDALEVKR